MFRRSTPIETASTDFTEVTPARGSDAAIAAIAREASVARREPPFARLGVTALLVEVPGHGGNRSEVSDAEADTQTACDAIRG